MNLDTEVPTFTYAKVHTSDKIYDKAGRVIDKEDAGDVNCVLRKKEFFYLATRKGVALLSANSDNLFAPMHNLVPGGENGKLKVDENSIYFIKTPGSAKHLAHIGNDSHFSLLYLKQPNPEQITATTESPANIINFSMEDGNGTMCGSNTSDSSTTGPGLLDTSDMNENYITTWSPNVNQYTISQANVCPVDGKNVLASKSNGQLVAACLGKGGLYVKNTNAYGEKVITFSDIKEDDKLGRTGSRPVNGVFVEDYENLDGGRVHDGFIYVANGACLTIIDAATLEIVADYTAFDATENLASANYVHVTKAKTATNVTTQDRIVTVAYGQAGVKVFKFIPPVKK